MMPSATVSDRAADLVDRLAGVSAGSALYALRHQRDAVAAATEGSHATLFDARLARSAIVDRLLVALYASALTPAPALVAHYRERLESIGADARSIAAVAGGTSDAIEAPRLSAMLAFTRILIERPVDGDRAVLHALLAAGLPTPDAVALAQLVAFVSYQARVVAGLCAMQAAEKTADPSPIVKAGEPPGAAHAFTMDTLGWRAWLPIVDLASATPEQIAVLEESHPQAKVSEYYRTLVHQPEILRQRSSAFNAIMYASGGLPRAERELAATVVSRVNGCVYCASVHAQRFEQLAKRRDVIEQVFEDPLAAGTNDRERAIVRFAVELTASPGNVGGGSIHALRQAGLAPLEIVDLIHAVAIFAWANRLMQNLGEPVRPVSAGAA